MLGITKVFVVGYIEKIGVLGVVDNEACLVCSLLIVERKTNRDTENLKKEIHQITFLSRMAAVAKKTFAVGMLLCIEGKLTILGDDEKFQRSSIQVTSFKILDRF